MNVIMGDPVAFEHNCSICFGTQFLPNVTPNNYFGILVLLYYTEVIVIVGEVNFNHCSIMFFFVCSTPFVLIPHLFLKESK